MFTEGSYPDSSEMIKVIFALSEANGTFAHKTLTGFRISIIVWRSRQINGDFDI